MASVHLQDEIARDPDRITVNTQFGPVKGGRAANGASVFLGEWISDNAAKSNLHCHHAISGRSTHHATSTRRRSLALTVRHLQQRSPTRSRRVGSRTRNLCLQDISTKTRSTFMRANVSLSKCRAVVYSSVSSLVAAQPTNDGQGAGVYFDDFMSFLFVIFGRI